MPAHARSLQITDTYRHHLQNLRQQAQAVARQQWRNLDPDNLDRSHAAWVQQVVPTVTALQRAGNRLSYAYLTAYLSSELGRRATATPINLAQGVGTARTGKALAEALVPSLFTTKAAIGEGKDVQTALGYGLDRATRVVGEEAIAPARSTLTGVMQADGRIIGWRRVTGGGCGACIAAATGAIQADDEVLEVHDHCQCSKEPVVADVPDHVERPTGAQIFEGMAAKAQDELLGPEKAALIRSGDVPLHALIHRDPMAVIPDGISEAPLEHLQALVHQG
jgi:hypothetical protein